MRARMWRFLQDFLALSVLNGASLLLIRCVFWPLLFLISRTCQSLCTLLLPRRPSLRSFFLRPNSLIRNHLSSSIVTLGHHYFLSKPKIDLRSSSSLLSWIIRPLISAIDIEVSFEPLYKLQVILVLSL